MPTSTIPSTKICGGKGGCGRELPLDAFHKHSAAPDGRQRICKKCKRACRAKFAARTDEEILAAQPDEKRCNSCKTVKPKSEFSMLRSARHGLMPKCKVCDTSKVSTWAKDNPDKANAKTALRKANKQRAQPDWLTECQVRWIGMYYTSAAAATKRTGVPHHVDHVIPFKGGNVSGLHVPWNLQVLPGSENCSKNNRHEGDDAWPIADQNAVKDAIRKLRSKRSAS